MRNTFSETVKNHGICRRKWKGYENMNETFELSDCMMVRSVTQERNAILDIGHVNTANYTIVGYTTQGAVQSVQGSCNVS